MAQTLQPKVYQSEGVDFLQGNINAILADDAGLGKSLQLIVAALKSGASRICVTCPAIGRVSWAIEFDKWGDNAVPVYQYPHDTAGLVPTGPCVLVVSQDWLSDKKKAKAFNALMRLAPRFDVGIHDEAHYLKNDEANRTRAVYGGATNEGSVSEWCERNWIASATLTPLNAGELYPHLRALFPGLLRRLFKGQIPTRAQFEDRYCDVSVGTYGRTIRGNNKTSIPELRTALAPYILSRRKTEVLPELNPIYGEVLPLEVATPAEVQEATAYMVGMHSTIGDEVFLDRLRDAYNAGAEAHSSARRALGELKVKPVVAWLKDWLKLNPGRKHIVFAHHTDVIHQLCRAFIDRSHPTGGIATITGATPANTRADQVNQFQTDPRVRLFIGQNKAAGTAITLTAASDVLLVEPDPSPENNYQIISRAHRLGQKDSVVARFAHVADNPIERRLAQVLSRRASDVSDLFGNEATGFIPKAA